MATTPNYSFSVYSSTDTDVRFLDFRVATAGSQSTSNFYVIDTVLKQHSDAIDSINATPSAFVVKGTYSAGSLYTASVANYPGYKNEQLIVLSLNQKNTGAVQININGTTNKDVMKYGSDGVLKAVDAGDFVSNSPVLCLYDGTQFVVIGITSGASITVVGEPKDILQIAENGTIESSGKKAAQPNGIATLDENGNVVQVANMANSAAAVYSGEPVTVEYAGAQRIASITAYGETPQGGTTDAPVALTGVDSVFVGGRNLLPKATKTQTIYGVTFTPNPDGSVSVSGTCAGGIATYNYADNLVPISPNQVVYLSGASQLVKVVINEKTPSGAFVRNVLVDRGQGISGTLTKQKEENILYATLQVQVGDTPNLTIYPMLNLGKSPLSYEPYSGSITALPIPRPLRRGGEVKDVCRTRVKSKWDKSLQVESSELKKNNANAYQYYVNTDTRNVNKNVEPGCNRFVPSYSAGISAFEGGFNFWMKEVLEVDDLEHAKAWFDEHPTKVFYQSTAYNGTNGLDVCLTEYQNGFVELDGTESNLEHFPEYENLAINGVMSAGSTTAPNVYGTCMSSHFAMVPVGASPLPENTVFGQPKYNRIIIHTSKWNSLETAKAYLAAQKSAGTPVQIAYQLATPETYATDPLDIDNAAGPVTVVTGGQVEVKMTDFVTDRTPAFLNKLDKTGDGSDVTVTFTEAATDTDIASGDKLSILFGKILKRFTNILNGTTKVGYATKADTDNLGNQITETYANSLDVADNTIVLKNKIGENLSTITVPYANSAGNVATSIKEMGIAVQTASPYAWFLNYTGSGNKDGARKYYASVYADNATYSTSAGSSNNIVIYNNNWSGTDGSISAVYANAEKTYVNLSSSNAAGTAWPNISVQRINGHVLNMALNGTSLSITW